MHVICHQDVRVLRAVELPGHFPEMMQVECIVLVRIEARGAVVAPLDDMQGKASQSQARTAGHGALASMGSS